MLNFNEAFSKIKKEMSDRNWVKEVDELLTGLKATNCIIYGAGMIGHMFYDFLTEHGIKVTAFCDTYLRGNDSATGVEIISPEELNKNFNNSTVISGLNTKNYQEVSATLREMNFDGTIIHNDLMLHYCLWMDTDSILPHLEKYNILWELLADDKSRQVMLHRMRYILLAEPMPYSQDQYFDHEIVNLTENEVFVDGGFYIGDTTDEFIRRTKGKFKHIYGFEPDSNNIAKSTTQRGGGGICCSKRAIQQG